PDEATYDAVIASLETSLDRAAAASPHPGRTATLRRLTRTEYQNAIRDLLALDVDVTSLLPPDDSSYGFDNVTVGTLSPTLLDRYVSAAEKISRVAVGRPTKSPGGDTIRTQVDLTQEEHIEGLPIGTRGGALVHYTFPLDGDYDITIRLTRDRNEHVEGLNEPHEVELLLDRERVQLFTVKPPQREAGFSEDYQPNHESVDRHLKVRMPVKAGPHAVGVAFLKNPSALLETVRQPYQAHFNSYRHPRIQPAVYSISVIGPYAATGAGDTPSRRRIFVSRRRRCRCEKDPDAVDAARVPASRDRGGPAGTVRALPEDANRGRIRGGHRDGALGRARQPRVSVPRRTGSGRHPGQHRVSRQRSGSGVAAVFLPLEQHSGR